MLRDDVTEPLLPTPPSSVYSGSKNGHVLSVVILAKTIIGAGSSALPAAFYHLGMVFSVLFLLLVALLTHFSIDALAASTVVTGGECSYPGVVERLLGKPCAKLLEISLVARCSGLMIVYIVVTADILCGSSSLPGLLPELFPEYQTWFSSRHLVAACITAAVFMPLVTPTRLSSTKLSSMIGIVAVVIWVSITVILACVVSIQGTSFVAPPIWPEWQHNPVSSMVNLLAVIPLLATAYTCQMSVHLVLKEMEDFSLENTSSVSFQAVSFCSLVFTSIGIGSLIVFGTPPDDVLEAFSVQALTAIVGSSTLATGISLLVRTSFLLSVIFIFPMQMLPYRESFIRLAFGDRDIGTTPLLLLTHGSLWACYLVAMGARSIWTPLQLVGATAGAVIAFLIPAMLAWRCDSDQHEQKHPMYSTRVWNTASCVLFGLGIVQAITGIWAIFLH